MFIYAIVLLTKHFDSSQSLMIGIPGPKFKIILFAVDRGNMYYFLHNSNVQSTADTIKGIHCNNHKFFVKTPHEAPGP